MNSLVNNQKFKKIISVIVTCCFLLTMPACSKTTTTTPKENAAQKVQKASDQTAGNTSETIQDPFANLMERAPKEPTNLQEFMNYPVGPLAGRDVKKEEDALAAKVKEVLPPIKEGADEATLDAWWRALLYLFSEPYPASDQVIAELKIKNFGAKGVTDSRMAFKDKVNIIIILDASGSMANKVDGKPMIDIAKASIQDFVADIPPGANVGLRVFGIEGEHKNDSKSTLLYPIQPMNSAKFNEALKPLTPKGWTPIARTLKDAEKDLAAFPGDKNTNLVYLVSDGIETCGGDPVAAAKSLANSGVKAVVNVIGFNADIAAQRQLREVSAAGGGLYANAGNQTQLKEALNSAKTILEQWEAWKKGALQDVSIQKNRQINQSLWFEHSWYQADGRESMNLFYITLRLRKDNYITSRANTYFAKKRSARTALVNKCSEETVGEIRDKIQQNFDKTLIKIDEQFKDNTKK
ncbi:MAG: vWA domain-containing protein [Candidatus Saccharibacteria bacterium]